MCKLLKKVRLITLICFSAAQAQVGIGTTTPNINSVLEISSSSQGVGFPRLTSVQRDAISAPANGLTIYNITLDCFQTNSGTPSSPIWNNWLGKAIVSSYSCTTAEAGAMVVGTPVTGVTQTITANVTSIGTYLLTATANGITFSASGTFTNTGNQNVVLTASGTPLSASGNPYTFTLDSNPSCSFTRTVTDPSTNGSAVVLSYFCSTSSAGNLAQGTAATGVTQTITANVSSIGTYDISTNTANGVIFSASGTFTSTGPQDVILTASGTPIGNGDFNFTLNTTPNCSFTRSVLDPSTNGTGKVTTYTCATDSKGTMVVGYPVSGVTQTITATVATVGTYSIAATSNGVTFSASGTFTATGAQNIILTATGTPTVINSNTFTLNTTPNCSFSRIVFGTVASATGKIWLDRNLGANQVATSASDFNSFGHFYQWGRLEDGHQIRTSSNTTTLSSSDVPGNNLFIRNATANFDWRSTQNNSLWQGISGINNPCPAGFRLPTSTEFSEEVKLFTSQNIAGAYSSVLKLTAAGSRAHNTATVGNEYSYGYYYTSSINGVNAAFLYYYNNSVSIASLPRATGASVRCINGEISTNGTAVVTSYNCNTASTGTMILGTPVSGVSQTITATVTSPGTYNITATANGIVFSATGTFTSVGNQDIILTATGTPIVSMTTFTLNTEPTCSFTRAAETNVVDVTSSSTGKVWMDRNLGASQVATSATDALSYGDLYQWGRASDGHQVRTSTVSVLGVTSSSDQPGNSLFLITNSSPYDWRNPQNTNLWQGSVGVNNPCPNGYRIPTSNELNAERALFATQNSAGAYNSSLKLTAGGYRVYNSGAFVNVGTFGGYWSSNITSTNSSLLQFNASSASIGGNGRAIGYSVRCIKGDISSGGSAIISAYNCTTASSGTLEVGTPVSGVTQTITATVVTPGAYSISAIANGVTFSGSGTLVSTGDQDIVLTATGTPTAVSSTFTLNTTPTCSFTRTAQAVISNSLNCSTATHNGLLIVGTSASGVSSSIGYVGGNLGIYDAQSIASTGVTGLTATLPAGTLAFSGNLVYTITGTPSSTGTASFAINIGGRSCTLTRTVFQSPCTIKINSTTYKEFKCWNLGADESLDPNIPVQGIHGNYYQWGRSQVVADAYTPDAAISGWNTVDNGSWNDTTKSANDPCPTGYRVPTATQWFNVLQNNTITRTGTWNGSSTNFGAAIHFGPDVNTKSVTLPVAGARNNGTGVLASRATFAVYWASTPGASGRAYNLSAGFTSANVANNSFRLSGMSVRCITE